jgi:hypothetical protein
MRTVTVDVQVQGFLQQACDIRCYTAFDFFPVDDCYLLCCWQGSSNGNAYCCKKEKTIVFFGYFLCNQRNLQQSQQQNEKKNFGFAK